MSYLLFYWFWKDVLINLCLFGAYVSQGILAKLVSADILKHQYRRESENEEDNNGEDSSINGYVE